MSIQALAWVLQNSKAELADRLVLIAIANHCDAHWCCYPSVDMIAAEARVNRATVFRSVKELVRLGELEVSQGGRGRGQRNTYRVAHYLGSQDETLNMDFRVASTQIKGRIYASHKEPLGTVISARGTSRDIQPWSSDGALEALSEEAKTKNAERLRALRKATG